MAALPEDADLNHMAWKIASCNFADLSPDNRVKIMQLCLDNERNDLLAEIEDNQRPVSEWFNKSRLWEARLD